MTRRCHQTTYVTCHMYVLSRKPAKRLGCFLFCEVGEIRGSGFSGKRWTNWVSSWTILQVFIPIDSLQVLLLKAAQRGKIVAIFCILRKKGDKKAKRVYYTVFQAPSVIYSALLFAYKIHCYLLIYGLFCVSCCCGLQTRQGKNVACFSSWVLLLSSFCYAKTCRIWFCFCPRSLSVLLPAK